MSQIDTQFVPPLVGSDNALAAATQGNGAAQILRRNDGSFDLALLDPRIVHALHVLSAHGLHARSAAR